MILVTGSTGYIGFHICEMLELKKIPYFGISTTFKTIFRMKTPNEFQKSRRVNPDIPKGGPAAPKAACTKVATVSKTKTEPLAMKSGPNNNIILDG